MDRLRPQAAGIVDDHNIVIRDTNGNYYDTICVTTGKIISTPMITSDTITVNVNEDGVNYIVYYNISEGGSITFKNKVSF